MASKLYKISAVAAALVFIYGTGSAFAHSWKGSHPPFLGPTGGHYKKAPGYFPAWHGKHPHHCRHDRHVRRHYFKKHHHRSGYVEHHLFLHHKKRRTHGGFSFWLFVY
jgi:hypothetical protein